MNNRGIRRRDGRGEELGRRDDSDMNWRVDFHEDAGFLINKDIVDLLSIDQGSQSVSDLRSCDVDLPH